MAPSPLLARLISLMACFLIDLEKELIKTKGGKGVCDQSSFFSTTSKQRQNALTWIGMRWSALVYLYTQSSIFLVLQTSSLANAAPVPVSLCTLDLELRPLLLRRSSCSLQPLQLDIIRHASNSGWSCLEPHCRPSCSSETSMLSNLDQLQLQLAILLHHRHVTCPNITGSPTCHRMIFCYVHGLPGDLPPFSSWAIYTRYVDGL